MLKATWNCQNCFENELAAMQKPTFVPSWVWFIRFSQENGSIDEDETFFLVLYMREKVISYFELSYLFWKNNGGRA